MTESSRDTNPEAPAACLLSHEAFTRRSRDLRQLLSRREAVRELDDGYALQFAVDDDLVRELVELVLLERKCCSFFRFDLTFEAEQGPLWVSVRGTTDVKSLVESWLE